MAPKKDWQEYVVVETTTWRIRAGSKVQAMAFLRGGAVQPTKSVLRIDGKRE